MDMKLNEFYEKIKTTNNNLVVLVGIPLSGKSTFIKTFEKYVNIISRDDIIMDISDDDIYVYNNVNHKLVDKELKEQMFTAGKTNDNYVIDLTSLTPKARNKTMVKFPKHTKIAIVFKIPSKEELAKRNEKRLLAGKGKTISEEVIDMMIEKYTIPTMDEDFDYIVYI